MKPVFKAEMEYLKLPHHWDDVLWVHLRSYCAFDRATGKRIVLGRNIDKLPWFSGDYLTHKELLTAHYNKVTAGKVSKEVSKLTSFLETNNVDEVIVSVSGGKDSTVMEHMMREVYSKYTNTILFGNTSNETHHTYKYVKDTYGDVLTIANPKEGFYAWCDRNGFIPSKLNRACCTDFKEGNISPYLKDKLDLRLIHLVGIRANESAMRGGYTQVKKGKWSSKKAEMNWDMYLPILDFDEFDVWAYIFYHGLEFNPLYTFGYAKVGCAMCPFRSLYELELNKHFLPTYHAKWQALLKKLFIREGYAVRINCTLEEYLATEWKGVSLRTEPTEEVIEDFARYRGLSLEDARKYFLGYKCQCCGKSLSKDVIAMNIKTLGTNTETRICLKCMSKYLETDIKTLKNSVKQHKDSGCKWF
ncbi:MAG: phosphoadenosine phosphosulfate reductase family protein [Cetobacterium sp.]